MAANTAEQLAKKKEEGASEYQKQKKVVGDLLSSAESAYFSSNSRLNRFCINSNSL